MKLHDLKPAAGSHTPAKRVGRGMAAARARPPGAAPRARSRGPAARIPAWFEGGQTPLHIRIPKLHGFRNRSRSSTRSSTSARSARLVELGAFEAERPAAGKAGQAAPITANQEILRAVGLVRTLDKPLKILGNGDASRAAVRPRPCVQRSALDKIEAAGGTVSVLESRPPDGGARRRPRPAEAPAAEATASRGCQGRRAAGKPPRPPPKAAPEPPAPRPSRGATGGAEAAAAEATDRPPPDRRGDRTRESADADRRRRRVFSRSSTRSGPRTSGGRSSSSLHPARLPAPGRGPGPERRPGALRTFFDSNQLPRAARHLLRRRAGDGLHHRPGPEPVHQRQHHHAAHAGRDPALGELSARVSTGATSSSSTPAT